MTMWQIMPATCAVYSLRLKISCKQTVFKHQKALRPLYSNPRDFAWQELVTLMSGLTFILEKAGGSGRKFVHPVSKATLFIHEPHLDKTLKSYQVRDAIELLKQEGIVS